MAAEYPVKPVGFAAVHLTDAFWGPRIELNRTVSIPFAFGKCEETGRISLFDRTAAAIRGEAGVDRTLPEFSFDDSDVYKIIEGAAYALSVRADAKLEAYVDGIIERIATAQESDGYLYPARALNPEKPHRWAGKERWELERVLSHELYNMGHFYEAAAAYYQATGKRAMLEIALRNAELLVKTFGPGKRSIWPGHQVLEMGLAKLYRVTGDRRYLELAKFVLDERGPDGFEGGGNPYTQSHKRVVEQEEAVGHAVRAAYMYAGMADVAALTGDASYVGAIDRIWENVVGKKLYITGGIGAKAEGEAFGADYELPNMSAYCETCAAIGNVYWNHRLFLLHGEGKYIDVLERTLYNGVISGISLDAKAFFYPNPLESEGQHERSPWFGCACCPSNVTRFMASVPGYVYAQRDEAVYVNLFVQGTAEMKLDSGRLVRLEQETRYPWDGKVKITVRGEGPFAVYVRIPGWARGEAVPSDLYRFADQVRDAATLEVNGKRVEMKVEKGYVRLEREWKSGDVIELGLPMPVRRVVAHEKVEADRGRVAVQRGPIVYCAEWCDNPGGVREMVVADGEELKAEWRGDLLGGVVVVKGKGITAIPYYAWANRGKGEMGVWVRRG